MSAMKKHKNYLDIDAINLFNSELAKEFDIQEGRQRHMATRSHNILKTYLQDTKKKSLRDLTGTTPEEIIQWIPMSGKGAFKLIQRMVHQAGGWFKGEEKNKDFIEKQKIKGQKFYDKHYETLDGEANFTLISSRQGYVSDKLKKWTEGRQDILVKPIEEAMPRADVALTNKLKRKGIVVYGQIVLDGIDNVKTLTEPEHDYLINHLKRQKLEMGLIQKANDEFDMHHGENTNKVSTQIQRIKKLIGYEPSSS